MRRTLGWLAEATDARLVAASPGTLVEGFALDSREVTPGCVFAAIRGARHDGHSHAAEAVAAGAIATLAQRAVQGPHLLVDSVEAALARLASSIRTEFSGPVVAITGSNGKTATKEFAAAVLGPLGCVLKSAGNRNTEWSSPLTWYELQQDQAAVVLEFAMRGAGQIRHLTLAARPTIGIVTMVGTAHIELLGSREAIAQAKGELLEALPPDGVGIIWQEDEFAALLKGLSAASVRTFGYSPDAECQIVGYRPVDWRSCVLRIRLAGRSVEARLATVGRHQALNAAAALLAADTAGVSLEAAAQELEGARLPPMRLEAIERRGATVLLDTYNASPDSAIAAVRTLAELPTPGRKMAVLGQMRELGAYSESGHRLVGRAMAEADLDRVLFVGELAAYARSEALRAGMPADRIADESGPDDVASVRAFLRELQPGDIVLIKASRALELERALQDEAATA